jgi:hypothetical protein
VPPLAFSCLTINSLAFAATATATRGSRCYRNYNIV